MVSRETVVCLKDNNTFHQKLLFKHCSYMYTCTYVHVCHTFYTGSACINEFGIQIIMVYPVASGKRLAMFCKLRICKFN